MHQQTAPSSVEDDPRENLAWYSEQRHSFVVATVLAITLPLPERDSETPCPVSWHDAGLPDDKEYRT